MNRYKNYLSHIKISITWIPDFHFTPSGMSKNGQKLYEHGTRCNLLKYKIISFWSILSTTVTFRVKILNENTQKYVDLPIVGGKQ